MKIIEPKIYVEDYDGIKIMKRLERACRTCYKSENLITENSYKHLLTNCLNRGHESILEHEKISIRMICDIGVYKDLTRHRFASFSIESTRYCNYSKSKFGQELTFIEPAWEFPSSDIINIKERFEAILGEAEANYMELITLGFKPQEARAVLPNALKTEIVVTAFIDDWKHFFELRCDSSAHPDIRKLALDLQKQFIDRKFI